MRSLISIGRFLLIQALIFPGTANLVCALEPVPSEKLIIIHDREIYLAGDTIRLKIINTDRAQGRMSQLSSTAYVELLGRGEQLAARTKVCMDDASGLGWIYIPDGVATDYYYIRAYTSWMKNSGPESFSYAMVPIVNTSRPLPGMALNYSVDPGSHEPGPGGLLISCEQMDSTEKKFRCGEEVRFSFLVRDINGSPLESHLSASVFLTGAASQPGRATGSEGSHTDPGGWSPDFMIHTMSDGSSSTLHFPELYGPAVSGQLLDKSSGQAAAGKLLTCSSLGSASEFQVFRTGKDGRFRFVPLDKGTYCDLVFQVPGDSIQPEFLFDDPYCRSFAEVSLPPWQVNENQLAYINLLSINRQVMANYYEPVAPGGPTPEGETDSFYGLPSETIDLYDYIGLPDMEEVIRELVRSVILYRKGGSLSLGVIDKGSREIIGDHPLFLLDGIPFYEHKVLLGLDPEKIRFVNVVDSKYIIGELEFDGIIDLRSVRGRSGEIEDFSSVLTYRHQGYDRTSQAQKSPGQAGQHGYSGGNLPDFRTLLYWNPELSFSKPGSASVSFSTPDVPGLYRVVVEGLSSDGFQGRLQFDFEIMP